MSSHSADEAAIRQSHQADIDALNRGDVKAWASSSRLARITSTVWATCQRAARTLSKGSRDC